MSTGTPELHMKWRGGGLIEVLKLAIHASVFPEKNFKFHSAVMAGMLPSIVGHIESKN